MVAITANLARERILNIAHALPAAPQILARLGEMLQNVDTSLDKIAALLKRDAALVARVIRVSNSTFFGGDGLIGSVEEAVTRVGFGEIYRLVGMATTNRLVDRALSYYNVETELLRENMLYTAIASEALAEAVKLDGRNAYTAGLLRPLGILVLDRMAYGLLPPSAAWSPLQHGHYSFWEGNVFCLNNCEVAAFILGDWRFPPDIVEAVRAHYLFNPADSGNRYACLLNIASWLATKDGFGLPGERVYWEQYARAIASIGMDEEQLRVIGVRVRDVFERFRQLLR